MARILLVEDDRDLRPLLEHVLLSAGYEVTAVETVKSAVSLIEAQPFDLVFTDVSLPDGSGLTVADKAKAAGIKELVITGYGLRLPAGSLETYHYLLKPVRVPELLKEVECRLNEQDGSQVVQFPKSS